MQDEIERPIATPAPAHTHTHTHTRAWRGGGRRGVPMIALAPATIAEAGMPLLVGHEADAVRAGPTPPPLAVPLPIPGRTQIFPGTRRDRPLGWWRGGHRPNPPSPSPPAAT